MKCTAHPRGRNWACVRLGSLTRIRSPNALCTFARRLRNFAEGMDSNHPSCELVVFQSSRIHGLGGFARVNILAGTRVIEYLGEIITKQESLACCERSNEYIFALDDT